MNHILIDPKTHNANYAFGYLRASVKNMLDKEHEWDRKNIETALQIIDNALSKPF